MIRRESNPFDNGKQSHMHPFPQGITSNGWKTPRPSAFRMANALYAWPSERGKKG